MTPLKPLHSLLIFCLSNTAIAGGPLVLEGPSGHVPATYQNPNIALNIEAGELGGTRTKEVSDQLVNDAMAFWNRIGTATINLTEGAPITVDIDGSNYTEYIPVPDSSTIHNDEDGLNPVVYDADGSIIDDYFGVAQGSGTYAPVVGFAASSIIIGSSYFTEGFAVINGNIPLPPLLTNEQLTLIIAHELGHFIGLDHSQVDLDNTESLNEGCPAVDSDDYPLMYPYACRENPLAHPDDDVAVSTLYPTADFFQSRAQLTGRFLTSDGVPVKGANLWIENTQTGQIYSIVSDYLMQCTGFFALTVPAGSYILHANSINREFNGGSSVGPWASSILDFSFQAPASTIGADLLFRADGNQPAIITLEAGKSVDVVFRTDGSGSITPDDNQVALSEIYTTAGTCPAAILSPGVDGGGGGGSPSLPLLAALLGIPLLRILGKKSVQIGNPAGCLPTQA